MVRKRNWTFCSPSRFNTISWIGEGAQAPPGPTTVPIGTSTPLAITDVASTPDPRTKKRMVGWTGVTQTGGVTAEDPTGSTSTPPETEAPSANVHPAPPPVKLPSGAGKYCA